MSLNPKLTIFKLPKSFLVRLFSDYSETNTAGHKIRSLKGDFLSLDTDFNSTDVHLIRSLVVLSYGFNTMND